METSTNEEIDIRSLLLPLADEPLLVPGSAVAEIVDYRDPEPRPQSPEWLLGDMAWRGQRVPVVSFEALTGRSRGEGEAGYRIAIVNALGGNPSRRFIGLVTHGIPRLVRAERSSVTRPSGNGREVSAGAKMNVLVHGEPAVIPDLDDIEERLSTL